MARRRCRWSGAGVWLVVPCYKVKAHILRRDRQDAGLGRGHRLRRRRLSRKARATSSRPTTPTRASWSCGWPKNQGVGGATLAGYAEAARRGGQVLVKVDGDDQMDLGYVAHLVAPILLGEADYAKGNRFTSISHLTTMPTVRVLGNAALSFAAKLSTGYWNIFDPTNGYTAIEARWREMVMEKRVSRRFFFETDLLYHLGTLRGGGARRADAGALRRRGLEPAHQRHRRALRAEAPDELRPAGARPVLRARLPRRQPGAGVRRVLHRCSGWATRAQLPGQPHPARPPRPAWSWPPPCR